MCAVNMSCQIGWQLWQMLLNSSEGTAEAPKRNVLSGDTTRLFVNLPDQKLFVGLFYFSKQDEMLLVSMRH